MVYTYLFSFGPLVQRCLRHIKRKNILYKISRHNTGYRLRMAYNKLLLANSVLSSSMLPSASAATSDLESGSAPYFP